MERRYVKVKTPITSIPFVKNHEFNYSKLISWMGPGAEKYTWIIYIFVVTFIITAVSNGANITDGLDGLAAGVSAIIGMALGVFIYVSGNYVLADYLNVMYIPNLGELSIFVGAFVGACIDFYGTMSIQHRYLWVILEALHWVVSLPLWPLLLEKNYSFLFFVVCF